MQDLILVILLVSAVYSVSSEDRYGPPNIRPSHDGQPGCGIRYEFRRLWRNNFNPEVYWECVHWRNPALQRTCPSSTYFQDSWQTCVPFTQWQWTPYSEPPTRPGCEAVAECEEIVVVPEPETECPWKCPNNNQTMTTPGPDIQTTSEINLNVTSSSPAPNTTSIVTEVPTTPEGGEGGGTDTEGMGRCEGASDYQHNPGTMSCFRPQCTISQWQEGTLYPTRDPTHFYQCGPGTNNLFTMPCAPGTCFSFRHQVCIHPRDWQNDCQ